jgi:hypothetical protein
LELEEEDDALIKQCGRGAFADCRCYGAQSSYLTALSSDLMFCFGHMSEWWWRLTGFAPGKAPLLPLDIRCKTAQEDLCVPYGTVVALSASQPSVSVAAPMSFDEDKLSSLISASITGAIHSMKIDMEKTIQQQVAAGIAEVLSQQNSTQGIVSRSIIPPCPSIETPAYPSSDSPHASSATIVPEPMDIDYSLSSKTPLDYLKLLYPNIEAPSF